MSTRLTRSREGGGNAASVSFVGTGAALPGYLDLRLPVSDLGDFLSAPENFAMKLVGLRRDDDSGTTAAALGFPNDGLSMWAMRKDVSDAVARGETLENFVAVRELDPAYGTKAVRKTTLPLVSGQHYRAARLVSDLAAGETVTLRRTRCGLMTREPQALTGLWSFRKNGCTKRLPAGGPRLKAFCLMAKR